MLDYFPITEKIIKPRPQQITVLNDIKHLRGLGYTHIVISAPVGAGKSAIAYAILNHNKGIKNSNGIYISPLNTLVDQIESSGFVGVRTIKGRKHYHCKSGAINCAEGYCQYDQCVNDRHAKRHCGTCNDNCDCKQCVYKSEMGKFRTSQIANTNFTLFLIGITNTPDLIIIDECDQIEDNIRRDLSLTLPVLFEHSNFNNHIEFLEEHKRMLEMEHAFIKDDTTQRKRIEKLLRVISKIMNIQDDYELYKERWCVSNDKLKGKTRYEPITINRFLEPILKGKTVIMMSATPQKLMDYEKITVGSPFPIETRHWQYKPIGKMSKRFRDKTVPSLALFLKGLKGKTLVHCVSYATAYHIKTELLKLKVYPLTQTQENTINDDEDSVTRYDAIESFVTAKDIDKILLSVKLDRGIDFWQPEIINNVLAVLPFPNPSEPIVKCKNELLGENWQSEKMAQDIMQQYGRIHRNEKMGIYNGIETPKRTYIVDGNWSWWYPKNKEYFEDWFKEAEKQALYGR